MIEPQLIPAQPLPVALHTTMPLPGPLAENWIWPCGLTVGDAGAIVRPEAVVMVIVPEPEALGSATDVAIICTVAGEGTEPGAVYRPLPETLPQAEPLQPDPERLHLTAVFVTPVRLAVNCC